MKKKLQIYIDTYSIIVFMYNLIFLFLNQNKIKFHTYLKKICILDYFTSKKEKQCIVVFLYNIYIYIYYKTYI